VLLFNNHNPAPSIAATVGGAFVFLGITKLLTAKLGLKTAEYSHHNG
jgi:hypothetical protein